MLFFLSKHSPVFLIVAALTGFTFPAISSAIFPYLPAVLFVLMLFTLLGIRQSALLKQIFKIDAWRYTVVHAGLTTLVLVMVGALFKASDDLVVALVAIGATGSLFATPAIARSVGLDALQAMAFTITSTLMMPIVLFVNLSLFGGETFNLDITGYFIRLTIFIFGPMLLAALTHRMVSQSSLSRIHTKLAQFTIVLVFSFPLGLVGEYRKLWDEQPSTALTMLGISFGICILFFSVALAIYWRSGSKAALVAAIASGNRNVLLTYAVAGSFLGPLYLPLIGALQLPTYLQPLVVKSLTRRFMKEGNKLKDKQMHGEAGKEIDG